VCYSSILLRSLPASLELYLLLADDALHRERSYSGLSRGTAANDVYLAVPEDEEHHGAPDVDDLIERLRQTVSRSEAKTLALDDLVTGPIPSRSSRIEELRAERHRLAPIVGRAPHPPFDALATVKHDEQLAVERLAAARRERQTAEEGLDELGGHRRITRRRNRQQAEMRIKRAQRLETGADDTLTNLGTRRADLQQQVAEWSTWIAEHGAEATRLREVDALITDYHRRHHPTLGPDQRITREVGPDTGIDLGL
jgi:hypothetical protein